jgi:phage recombination protein Bet
MDTQTIYSFTEQANSSGLYDIDLDEEKVQLIRRTIARGASEDELALFVEQCRRTGLDPFARQIYSVRRKQWSSLSRSFEEAQVIQVSIDGFRLIADRTHKYAGQVGPWWCGPDGEWKEVWLMDETPSAAKVGVLRNDFNQPLFAIALYKSYVQTNSQGDPISRWKTDPAAMVAGVQETTGIAQTRITTQRPFSPEMLRANFSKAVATIQAKGLQLGPDDFTITESALHNLLEEEHDLERYLEFVTGFPYIEDMDEAHIIALLRLLKPSNIDGTFIPGDDAQSEAVSVIAWLETGDRENATQNETK